MDIFFRRQMFPKPHEWGSAEQCENIDGPICSLYVYVV